MFQLRQDIDTNLEQQIMKRFTQFKIKPSSDLCLLEFQMMEQFSKIFQESPEFSCQTLLPNIKKWNLRLFSLISSGKKAHKMKDLEKRLTQVKFFKSIQHIDFSSVRRLYLEEVQLDNIEPLCFMRLGNLQNLDLSFNFITSLKPLAKLHLPLLTNVAMLGNPYQVQQYMYLPKVSYSFYPVFIQVFIQVLSSKNHIIKSWITQRQESILLINNQLFKLNKKFHSDLCFINTDYIFSYNSVRKAWKEKFYKP